MRQITAVGKGGSSDWSLGHTLTLPSGHALVLGDPQLGVHPHSEFSPGMVADVCMMECTVCCLLDGDDGAWFKNQVEQAGGRWTYHPNGVLPIVLPVAGVKSVSTSSLLKKAAKDSGKALLSLFFLGLVVWFLFVPQRYKYAMKYGVPIENVVMPPSKPTDCDWTHAPLGNKDCHYEKQVLLRNANGQLVGGENFFEAGTKRSFDHEPQDKVTDVYIEWIKVNESGE
jgi:hypothetical protein